MAFTKFKPSNITVAHGALSLSGVQSVVITENAAPLPAEEDTTSAPASVYEFTTDPLGGKGQAKTTVVVKGLASKADFNDSGITSIAKGTTGTLTIKPNGAQNGDDQFVLTVAKFTGYKQSIPVDQWVPYEITFEKNALGTWSTQ